MARLDNLVEDLAANMAEEEERKEERKEERIKEKCRFCTKKFKIKSTLRYHMVR